MQYSLPSLTNLWVTPSSIKLQKVHPTIKKDINTEFNTAATSTAKHAFVRKLSYEAILKPNMETPSPKKRTKTIKHRNNRITKTMT